MGIFGGPKVPDTVSDAKRAQIIRASKAADRKYKDPYQKGLASKSRSSAKQAAKSRAPGRGQQQMRALPVPECASAAPGVSLAGRAGTDVAPAPAGRAQARPAARAPKRAQAHRAPVTAESAEAQFAAVLAEGRAPSLRQVKAELGVGTDKARQLREHMENLTRA